MRSAALLLVLLFCACGATRKQMEAAVGLEREGRLDEAYSRYADLFERKPGKDEAREGMQRVARSILDRKQADAMGFYLMNDLKAGDRARQAALDYQLEMKQAGFDLRWDPLVDDRREDAVLHEAERLYDEAAAALREEQFDEAKALAEQCLQLNRKHLKAPHLIRMAEAEPVYREGKRAEALGLWRQAYGKYKRVAELDATHADVLDGMERCRKKLSYTLAYIPVQPQPTQRKILGVSMAAGPVDAELAAALQQELLAMKDPFLTLVDRAHTDHLLSEQRRQMNGVFDDQQIAKAGKLLGARYVLTGKIIRFDDVLGKQIEVQMQVLDAESGRVHVSEVVRAGRQDLGPGGARAQLLSAVAKRAAQMLAAFEPDKG